MGYVAVKGDQIAFETMMVESEPLVIEPQRMHAGGVEVVYETAGLRLRGNQP